MLGKGIEYRRLRSERVEEEKLGLRRGTWRVIGSVVMKGKERESSKRVRS